MIWGYPYFWKHPYQGGIKQYTCKMYANFELFAHNSIVWVGNIVSPGCWWLLYLMVMLMFISHIGNWVQKLVNPAVEHHHETYFIFRIWIICILASVIDFWAVHDKKHLKKMSSRWRHHLKCMRVCSQGIPTLCELKGLKFNERKQPKAYC